MDFATSPPPHFYCFLYTSTTLIVLFFPATFTNTTAFLLFPFHHHHHHILLFSPAATTAFSLFSLHHHHIDCIDFPAPPPTPPHLYCFLYTTTFLLFPSAATFLLPLPHFYLLFYFSCPFILLIFCILSAMKTASLKSTRKSTSNTRSSAGLTK